MATRNPQDLLAHKPLSSDPAWVASSGGLLNAGSVFGSGVLGSGESNYFDFSQRLVSFAQPQYSYSKFDGTEHFAPIMFSEGKILYWWESGANDGQSLEGDISDVTQSSLIAGSKDFRGVAGAFVTTFDHLGAKSQETIATGGDASGTVTVAGWPDGAGLDDSELRQMVGSTYKISFAGDEGASGIGVRNVWISPHPNSGFYWSGVARSDTPMMILNSGINQSLVYWNKLESDLSSAIKSKKTVKDQHIDAYTVSGEIIESSGMSPYYEADETNPTVFNPYVHYHPVKRSRGGIVGRGKHNKDAVSIPPAIVFQETPDKPLKVKGYSITGGGVAKSFAGSWVPYTMQAPYHGKLPYPTGEEVPTPPPTGTPDASGAVYYSCIKGSVIDPDQTNGFNSEGQFCIRNVSGIDPITGHDYSGWQYNPVDIPLSSKPNYHATYNECVSAGCGGVLTGARYSCVNGQCQPDVNGKYSSKSECETKCGTSDQDDPVGGSTNV